LAAVSASSLPHAALDSPTPATSRSPIALRSLDLLMGYALLNNGAREVVT
jgi:hypothetical protein